MSSSAAIHLAICYYYYYCDFAPTSDFFSGNTFYLYLFVAVIVPMALDSSSFMLLETASFSSIMVVLRLSKTASELFLRTPIVTSTIFVSLPSEWCMQNHTVPPHISNSIVALATFGFLRFSMSVCFEIITLTQIQCTVPH